MDLESLSRAGGAEAVLTVLPGFFFPDLATGLSPDSGCETAAKRPVRGFLTGL
jgi:hypothetical protein